MKIRQASIGDKEQILKLVGGLYSRSAPMMLREWDKHFRRMVKQTIVVEIDKNLVAYLSFSFYKKSLFIGDLYVKPKYRRKGVARKLLISMETIRKNLGKESLLVNVRDKDRSARKLYSNHGFEFFKMNNKTSRWLIKR